MVNTPRKFQGSTSDDGMFTIPAFGSSVQTNAGAKSVMFGFFSGSSSNSYTYSGNPVVYPFITYTIRYTKSGS